MKMNMEHWWNGTDRGKQKYSVKQRLKVPLCPPQTSRGLTWDLKQMKTKNLRGVNIPFGGYKSELVKGNNHCPEIDTENTFCQ